MNRFLPWISGLAAVVLTASGEYALYCACGFDHHVAAAGPVCLDAYLLAAIWARREVFLAMLVMVATNATAHLLPPTGPPHAVVVAVSALAPVVLWRVHELTGHTGPATPAVPDAKTDAAVPVNESPAPGWSDQSQHVAMDVLSSANDVRDDHVLTAATGVERGGVTLSDDQRDDHQVVHTAVMSAVSGRAEDDHRHDRLDDHYAVATSVISPVMSPRVGDHRDDHPDDQRNAPVMTDARTLRAARRLHAAALKETGRPVTIATLRDELDLSRRDATTMRQHLIGTRG